MTRRLLYHGWTRRRLAPVLALADDLEVTELDWSLRRQGLRSFSGLARQLRGASEFGAGAALSETYGIDVLPLLWLARNRGLPLALRLRGNPWLEAVDGLELLPAELRLRRRATWAIARRALASASLLLPIATNLHEAAAAALPGVPQCLVENLIHDLAAADSAPVGRCAKRLISVTNFSFLAKIEPLLAIAPAVDRWCCRAGVQWWLVGDGWFAEIARARLQDCRSIVWCGHRPIAEVYAERPLLLYPTGLDALPGALVEAAAWRLPIVVDPRSVAGALIDDEEAALKVELDRVEALDEALDTLMGDENRRDQLGRRAGAWVRERFAPARLAGQINSALDSLFAGGNANTHLVDPSL